MSDAIRVMKTMQAVRPEVLVLWNGVSLQELGIADSLLSVSFSTTCGRSKASKKHPSGKPKVGGAQIAFELTNNKVAEVLATLVHSDTRPNISVSFGYEGAESYWQGSFNAAQVVDTKKFKKASSFKVDRVEWAYSSNGIPKLTINGISDTAVTLSTNVSPRLYNKKMLKDVFQAVADDNGLILDIDENLPVNLATEYVIKATEETDYDFVDRLATMVGGEAYLVEGIGEYGATGITSRFKLSGNTTGASITKMRDTVRGILRVASVPAFLDLSKYDQVRPLKIGFGTLLTSEQRHSCDVLAVSVSISDIRHKNGGGGAKAKIVKKAAGEVFQVHTSYPGLMEMASFGVIGAAVPLSAMALERIKSGAAFGVPEGPITVDAATRDERQKLAYTYLSGRNPTGKASSSVAVGTKQAQDTEPSKDRGQIISSVPIDIEPTGKLNSARLAKLALDANFEFEISITIKPGIPYIQAPFQVELIGTHAHDGPYSIEEASTSWSSSGLETTLKIRPLKFKAPGANKKKDKDKDASGRYVFSFDKEVGTSRGQGAYVLELGKATQIDVANVGIVKARQEGTDKAGQPQKPVPVSR